MRRHIVTSLVMFVVLTVLLGLIYPLAVYAIGQAGFKDKAEGSLVKVDGHVAGSKLIAEDFTSPQYFHPRPSKAGTGYDGNGYDAGASAASILRRNLLIYGVGGVVAPFIAIKLIDLVVSGLGVH